MIDPNGIAHIQLTVRDVTRSRPFYQVHAALPASGVVVRALDRRDGERRGCRRPGEDHRRCEAVIAVAVGLQRTASASARSGRIPGSMAAS